MKILVTGGAGFIGSHVVDAYMDAGHEVLVLDDLSSGKPSNVHPRARFFEMDIRSPEAADLIGREKPDVVNHHAAQISVPDSVSDPLLDADINLRGLLNVLEASRAARVGKFIFISSGGAIYGEAEEYPTSEKASVRPLSPYAVSKYASELYLRYYRHQYGLNYTTLRYANIYGPRQIRHGEAGVVAIFMGNLRRGIPSTVNCFEDDPEGMVRDYCFVGDAAGANLLALEAGGGDCFNIGTGVGTKTLPLYKLILEAYEKIIEAVPVRLRDPLKGAARAGDLARSRLLVEKARKGLGWEPQTDLKAGIERTLEWRMAHAAGR